MIKFKEGQICFSGGNSFMQKAIRFFLGKNALYSHSFVVVKGPHEILSALETTETRVTLTPVSRKLDENNWIEVWEAVHPDITKAITINSLRAYILYSGWFYGYFSYVWFIYRWVVRLFGVEPKRMWRWANRGITCTELTMVSYPYVIDDDRDINTVDPMILRDHVSKNKDFKFVGYINLDLMGK